MVSAFVYQNRHQKSFMLSVVCVYMYDNGNLIHLFIVVNGNQYSEPPSSAIKFPIAADLVNYTKNIKHVSEITIPPSLVQERMEEKENNGKLKL